MELLNTPQDAQSPTSSINNKDFLEVACNWKISNNRQFPDAVTTGSSNRKPENIDIEDVVSLETCINVEPQENISEPCMIDIKVLNGQRISHIAIVSGAYILEFFKQYGEYEKTVVASVLDDFTSESVCFAETAIRPCATEASIKFTKTVRPDTSMWIYGIKLYLTDPVEVRNDISAGLFNPEIIKSFLSKCAIAEKHNQAQTELPNHGTSVSNMNITAYIDNKLLDMETRLMKRINTMEEGINEKLDTILQQVQSIVIQRTDSSNGIV